jgi:hypothetical protein
VVVSVSPIVSRVYLLSCICIRIKFKQMLILIRRSRITAYLAFSCVWELGGKELAKSQKCGGKGGCIGL